MSEQLKTENYKLRLSPAQKDALKSRAAEFQISISDYIRFQTLGPAAVDKMPNGPALVSVSAELRRLGNNLNQAVKLANEADKSGTLSAHQFSQIHKALKATLEMKTGLERKISKALHLPK